MTISHHCMSVSEKSLSYRDIAYRWHAIVLLKQGCYERSRCRSKLYVPGRNCVVVPTGAKTHLFDCLRAIVTLFLGADYKKSYLLTYLLTYC